MLRPFNFRLKIRSLLLLIVVLAMVYATLLLQMHHIVRTSRAEDVMKVQRHIDAMTMGGGLDVQQRASKMPSQHIRAFTNDTVVAGNGGRYAWLSRKSQTLSSPLVYPNYTHHVRPSTDYQVNATDLWEQPYYQERLPPWLVSYLRWHKQTRAHLRLENHQQHKYLIMTCQAHHLYCGGTADRLSSLPFLLKLASQTDRVFMIYWTRPAALEHFLRPPQHGLDWRVPAWLVPILQAEQEKAGWSHNDHDSETATLTTIRVQHRVLEAMPTVVPFVLTRFQANDHGALYYDHTRRNNVTELPFTAVFAAIWKVTFTPAPAVADRIRRVLQEQGLQPHRYVATHLRALYNVEKRPSYLLQNWARNAINCATRQVREQYERAYHASSRPSFDWRPPPRPVIFFTSDSDQATLYAVEYGHAHHWPVAVRPHAPPAPLHLDRTRDWQQRPPADWYDAFVDLYVLSLAACVGTSMGGYGVFASWLSDNRDCWLRHHEVTRLNKCDLVEAATVFGNNTSSEIEMISSNNRLTSSRQHPLFVPPVEDHQTGTPLDKPPSPQELVDAFRSRRGPLETTIQLDHQQLNDSTSGSNSFLHAKTIPLNPVIPLTHIDQVQVIDGPDDAFYAARQPTFSFPNVRAAPSQRIWEQSTTLPQWTKDYFSWHQAQRHNLTGSNWSYHRFLAVTCFQDDLKCGGTSDRLHPLPFFIRLAAESQRLLFIVWERPAPLESWLMPPQGGVDWRAPAWLMKRFRTVQDVVGTTHKAIRYANDVSRTIVVVKLQSHDHGSLYYNERAVKLGEPADAFRQHYRDCWFSFFTPVPRVAEQVTDELDRMRLTPGNFSVAHVRALYGTEMEGQNVTVVQTWTANALNCLSKLRPGGPYFFASDSHEAKRYALDYGKRHGVYVATWESVDVPVHLDLPLASGRELEVTNFDGVFVDLYVMSFAYCVSYNMGSFAKWGQLLSGAGFGCNVRHWTAGVGRMTANKNGCPWMQLSQPLQTQLTTKRVKRPLFLPPLA